ncbi:hypothetical protein [Actinokineospora enzanensis]|uniref:hypothetical protein n=1 Tax=Actinokineospora enzanensis TaxID=155975 RepID=UPI0003A68FC5|nr:hypothetical protein [Actinokineospora enzanensis]
MLYLAVEPAFGVPFDTVLADRLWLPGAATTAGVGILLWILFGTVWGPWLIARVRLPLTGKAALGHHHLPARRPPPRRAAAGGRGLPVPPRPTT